MFSLAPSDTVPARELASVASLLPVVLEVRAPYSALIDSCAGHLSFLLDREGVLAPEVASTDHMVRKRVALLPLVIVKGLNLH